MKPARYIVAIPVSLMMLCGCSDSNDPLPEPELRLPDLVASITSERSEEEFIYDDENRIVKWTSSSKFKDDIISCSYKYPDDNTITMDLLDKTVFSASQTQTRHHDVRLTLDNDGLVTVADAIFNGTEYNGIELRKKYRHEFEYDDNGHLVRITMTEWNAGNAGWDMDHPWQWVNTLTWDGDNLIRYEDSHGSNKPRIIQEYSYSGIPVAQHKPIAFPIINAGYIPLQLTGRFGKQTAGEVMGETVTYSNGQRNHNGYEYEFTTTATGTIISRYWKRRDDGTELEYRIKWIRSR